MRIFNRTLAAGLVLVCLAASGASNVSGRVVAGFADPSDFVIELDKPGECGSKYFHIRRNKANFREVAAAALTAVAAGKPMLLFVESCQGDRNILSHGAVFG
jgi:hypothetical protein